MSVPHQSLPKWVVLAKAAFSLAATEVSTHDSAARIMKLTVAIVLANARL
jgi:hypothetical protein